jgi:hypothetical protein
VDPGFPLDRSVEPPVAVVYLLLIGTIIMGLGLFVLDSWELGVGSVGAWEHGSKT